MKKQVIIICTLLLILFCSTNLVYAGGSVKLSNTNIIISEGTILVFFYKDFNTSYTYTKIGEIRDGDAFAQAVGDGNVTITIQKSRQIR